jgi:hypothetical protein
MTCRGIISICAVMAFLLGQRLPADQAGNTTGAENTANDATKTIKKKAKKAGRQTEEATSTAASATQEKAEKTTRKARKTANLPAPEPAATPETGTPTRARHSAVGTASREESSTGATAPNAKPAPARIVSDSEIAAAKASGQVWVNTETGVYHKGGRWYGATKQGKFMTEPEATKAGYHLSKGKS